MQYLYSAYSTCTHDSSKNAPINSPVRQLDVSNRLAELDSKSPSHKSNEIKTSKTVLAFSLTYEVLYVLPSPQQIAPPLTCNHVGRITGGRS